MKHLSILFILSVFTIVTAYSQPKAISGKIGYTATVRYSLFIAGTQDKTDTTYLYFNDTSSAYLLDVPRNLDTKKISAQLGDIDPTVKEQLLAQMTSIYDKQKVDFSYHRNNTNTISRSWLDPRADAYCMVDTLPDFNWELLPDTMRILGYLCQKATCTSFLGSAMRKFTAWYTPDIPASYGPAKFFGLPGLILMINNAYYNYTAVSIRMPIETDEMVKVRPCYGLPTISRRQADEIGSKARTDLMNMQKLRSN